MKRYFLDFHDGSDLPDHEGSEFSDAAKVKEAARLSLLEMAKDATIGKDTVNLSVHVRDASGAEVLVGSLSLRLHTAD